MTGIKKTTDSGGDRIFKCYHNGEDVAMFRVNSEAEEYMKARLNGKSITGKILRRANNKNRK